ncbi:unnamed protein product [Kuraishia capsulata CBS 1993]|uniref:Cytochrome b5 heme-binding domain-containing protein n=1 Tax=Kuraishia capsulata CBS 1993 TaxID=1382522 RepID=W6MMD6_9ASCO|nr:uncharacterized protein KUCA_T00002038001 [Kuraishia capsulata CBS 1993]CDK26067.1 unnamed protein product [Kuraishia capsulata CBS 1993]
MSVKSYTFDEIAQHNTREDLWIVYNGEVFDCSEYLDEHPGGEEVIMECGGTDSTEPFDDIGHSEDAKEMLEGMKIGVVAGGIPKRAAAASSGSSSGGSSLPLVAGVGIALAAVAYFILKK